MAIVPSNKLRAHTIKMGIDIYIPLVSFNSFFHVFHLKIPSSLDSMYQMLLQIFPKKMNEYCFTRYHYKQLRGESKIGIKPYFIPN